MSRRKSGFAIAAAGAAFTIALLASPSASAITGSEAVAICEVRAGCRSNVGSEGDIVILYNDHVIWCDGADGDCIQVTRQSFSNRSAISRAEAVLSSRAAATTPTTPTTPPAPTPGQRDHRRQN